jgi:hypothetical protein
MSHLLLSGRKTPTWLGDFPKKLQNHHLNGLNGERGQLQYQYVHSKPQRLFFFLVLLFIFHIEHGAK